MGISENKKILCIIPARGGSKGILRKNLADLGGIPLLAWSIRVALSSKLVTRVIVSTEDKEIANVARRFGAEVPYMRPEEFATDTASITDVVKHLLSSLKEQENYVPDVTLTLYPTSPFRTPSLVDHIISLCLGETFTASTVRAEFWNPGFYFGKKNDAWQVINSEPPTPCYKSLGHILCEAKYPDDFLQAKSKIESMRAVANHIRQGGKQFNGPIYLPLSDEAMLLDIDTPEQLEYARLLLAQKRIPWNAASKSYLSPNSDNVAMYLQHPKECSLQKLFVCSAHDPAKREEITLDSFASPSLLRDIIDSKTSFARKDVFIFSHDAASKAFPISSTPTVSVNQSERLQVGTLKVFSRLGRVLYNFEEVSGIDYKDISEPFRISKKEKIFTITLPIEQMLENDELDFGIQENGKSSYFRYKIKNKKIVARNFYTADNEKEFIEFSNDFSQCSIPTTNQTERIYLGHLRPGFPQIPQNIALEPRTIKGFIRYDNQRKNFQNELTGETITGRQLLPEIHAWTGFAFLPARIEKNVTWDVIPDSSISSIREAA